jgi:hypothetical protein
VPIDEARRMSRGPRMNPKLYDALKEKIELLDNTAARLTAPEDMSTATMKKCILHVATELNIPVTVRKIPLGLLFWRSIDEDLQHVQKVVARLQGSQQPPHTRRRGRRWRG